MYRIWFERQPPERCAALLDGVATVLGPGTATPDDPLRDFGDADAAVLALGHIGPAELDLAPGLRVLSRAGIGLDSIDVAEATRRGIVVCNTPGAPTVPTAEFAIALLLAAAKDIAGARTALRTGGQPDFHTAHQAMELDGRLLGIVGLGRIGVRVARAALALGMRVQAHDPFIDPDRSAEPGVELVATLPELLAACDIVSLHLPLSEETVGLIGRSELELMRPGSILVNVARGALVDQEALLDALTNGPLARAALDVTDPEPLPPDHALLHRDDVIVTPHVASATDECRSRMCEQAVSNALAALRGECPDDVVNPEVWSGRRGGAG